jgi:hypothetical protein
VARVEELVLGSVPRYGTTKMHADSVDPLGGEGLAGLHDKVGRITMEDTHDFSNLTSESFRMITSS